MQIKILTAMKVSFFQKGIQKFGLIRGLRKNDVLLTCEVFFVDMKTIYTHYSKYKFNFYSKDLCGN